MPTANSDDRGPVEYAPSDVLLSLQAATARQLLVAEPDLPIAYSEIQRSWFYRPPNETSPFPATLLAHLPQPPSDEGGRTYLAFPGNLQDANAAGIRWDPFVKCWWFPSNPDLLPQEISKYLPPLYSWPAWCQQRVNPSTSRCQTDFTHVEPSAAAVVLATEMFRASFTDQPGFLFLCPCDPEHRLALWQATHRMNANHPTTIVIVTQSSDVALWEHILNHVGTQPASVLLLTYREIHLLNPRLPRNEQTPTRAIPSTYGPVPADVVIWDQCHVLRGAERRRGSLFQQIACHTGWNIWVSDNPCASPADLDVLLPLIADRTPELFEHLSRNPVPQGSLERWLSWRSPSPSKPASEAIQRGLFTRDARGALAAIRSVPVSSKSPRVICRPIGSSQGHGHAPSGHDRNAYLLDLARSLLIEGRQVIVVTNSDDHIAHFSAIRDVKTDLIATLRSNDRPPAELPLWIDRFRLVVIHQNQIYPGPPLPVALSNRVLLVEALPETTTDLAALISMSGAGTRVLLPYHADCAVEQKYPQAVQQLVRAFAGANLGTSVPLEIY